MARNRATETPQETVQLDHNAHVRYATLSGVGLVAIIGLVMMLIWVMVDSGNRDDQRAKDMLEARRSSCLQANAQTTRDRKAATNLASVSARQLIATSNRLAVEQGRTPTPTEVGERFIRDQEAAAAMQVKTDYPYRDCSDEGVAAFFSKPPAPVQCVADGKGFCREG